VAQVISEVPSAASSWAELLYQSPAFGIYKLANKVRFHINNLPHQSLDTRDILGEGYLRKTSSCRNCMENVRTLS
jgi:hypothetical protein